MKNNILTLVETAFKRTCTKKVLYRRLPILQWLPRYSKQDAIGDLVAGFTVGLMIIPQSLACANVAGLPPQYGLYSSFFGCFVYIIFGSCKDIAMGPTVIVSLLTYQATQGNPVEYAILLCFLSGVIEFLMGIFNLGFLMDFISGPVSSGFTSAVAIIVTVNQAKDVLGVKISGNTFVTMCISMFSNITNLNIWDTVMGIICIAALIIIHILVSRKLEPQNGPKTDGENEGKVSRREVLIKILWFICNCRNALVIIVCASIGYWSLLNYEESPLTLVREVPSGLPAVKLPPFTSTSNNQTNTFVDMVTSFGSGLIIVPLLSLLENIAVCKSFADGKTVDATQEMIAVGLCNIANSFVQGHPGSGAMARSAVNRRSGVRTQLGGLYTGVLVISALLFLTVYFYYIPKCCLAAIVISAIVFMIDAKVIKPMWKTKKSDFWIGLVTFIACLVLPLEIGMVFGIIIHLLVILFYASRPKISIEKQTTSNGTAYLLLTPDRFLVFPSAEYVRHLVTKHSVREGIPMVIDCTHLNESDYTTATVIETLTINFSTRKQKLLFYNLKPRVMSMFEALSPKDFVILNSKEDVDKIITMETRF